jgi:hypothetical protein
LARVLDLLPDRLLIFGIEGSQFETGAAPSEAVMDAVQQLAQRIAEERVGSYVSGNSR